MTFEKTFCSSPWFHMRITNSGTYEYCRWYGGITQFDNQNNIKSKSPIEYFQNDLAPLRKNMLDGKTIKGCSSCHVMEQHQKISGRQRQLLKSGIQLPFFVKSLASSPMKASFDYSQANAGHTQRTVSDWQIDLGNYCNSACVFCAPEFSSRLASEYKSLGLIDQTPPQAWCDDTDLVERFVKDLCQGQPIHYLHFIGGETLITPGFVRILEALVTNGISQHVTLGFTTNLTTWSDHTADLLTKFKQINLGISMETTTKINDYVRWPSQIDQVLKHAQDWLDLARKHGWLTQLRITPTCLTVHELDTMYEYAWQNNLAVESCNFLERPEHLRIGVLPKTFRQLAHARLENWIKKHPIAQQDQIVNGRNPSTIRQQIVQDALSYLHYLDQAQDESHRLPDLVAYLKLLESRRGNRVLNYIPQYEELFRSAGY